MNINTYYLRGNNEVNSDNYYREVSRFTDTVLDKIVKIGEDAISEYINYFLVCKNEESINQKSINKKEIQLEFLLLGVLWEVYLPMAMKSNKITEKSLFFLSKLRQSNNCFKKIVDLFRGVLATLLYDINPNAKLYLTPEADILYSLNRLIAWLEATGEFEMEVIRLEKWYDFLSELSPDKRYFYLERSLQLANWFRESSDDVIGKYTVNVESFLQKQGREHYWSEDIIFCNRKKVEYHLNMVGAEILNRVYRKDYKQTEKKLIMLPACMKLKQTNCEAEKTNFGYRCVHCSLKCNVSCITYLGEENNVDVFIIPHESMLFSRKASKNILGNDIAIIGVACPLHLISGGWKSCEIDIPAQCVLLDYCGCKKHWDEDGIATEINYEKLKQILNIESSNTMIAE